MSPLFQGQAIRKGGSKMIQCSSIGRLAHLVLALALSGTSGVLGQELVLNLDVKVAAVSVVGLDVQGTLNLLASLHGDHVLEVEDSLLPVGVLGVGAGREADGLVGGGEVDVEPGNKGVDEVIAAGRELEGGGEGEVGNLALVEVQGQDRCGVSNHRLHLDRVNQGLGKSSGLEGAVVKAVDVVPDCLAVSFCLHNPAKFS